MCIQIEQLTNEIDGVDKATLDFVTKKLRVKVHEEKKTKGIIAEIKKIVNRLEPDVNIIEEMEASQHDHSHEHDHLDRKDIIRIILSGILFIIPGLLKLDGVPRFAVYLLAYIIIGLEIIIKAVRNLVAGHPFDEYF